MRSSWPAPRAGGAHSLRGRAGPGGACPDLVLGVGAPPTLQGTTPEVVLAPPATSGTLFLAFTIQPLRGGPLLVFSSGAAPLDLLAPMNAFFPTEEAPQGDQPRGGDDAEPQVNDQQLVLELDVDEYDEYLLN